MVLIPRRGPRVHSSRSESGGGCRAWPVRTVVFLPSGVRCVWGGEGDGEFPERERASLLSNVLFPRGLGDRHIFGGGPGWLTGLAWTGPYARSLAVQSCRFRAGHAKPRCRSPINLLPAWPPSAPPVFLRGQTVHRTTAIPTTAGRRSSPQRPRKVYHVVHQSHNRYK